MAEPDYTDPEVVKRWLEEQAADPATHDRVLVFAARCALRTFPLVTDEEDADFAQRIVWVLRACAVPWLFSQIPNLTKELRQIAEYCVSGAVFMSRYVNTHNQKYYYDAVLSAEAASAAASVAFETKASKLAEHALTSFRLATSKSEQIHKETAKDIELLESGETPTDLSYKGIWLFGVPTSASAQIAGMYKKFPLSNALLFNWYEARIQGSLTHPLLSKEANWDIEYARVTGRYRGIQRISEFDWDDLSFIDHEIQEVIEEETEKDKLNQFISDYPPPPVHVGELVLRIVDNAAAPVTVGEVADAVNNVTGGTPRSSVNWYLSKFYRESRIHRIKRGVYASNVHAPEKEDEGSQRPAPFIFRYQGGKIYARPFNPEIEAKEADAAFNALKKAIQSLLQACGTDNSPFAGFIRDQVALLSKAIGDELSDLDSGTMLTGLDTFDVILARVQSAAGQSELNLTVSTGAELIERHLSTLAALSPRVGEIVAARRLLRLKPEDREKLDKARESIVFVAELEVLSDVIDKTARDALSANRDRVRSFVERLDRAESFEERIKIEAALDELRKLEVLSLANFDGAVAGAIEANEIPNDSKSDFKRFTELVREKWPDVASDAVLDLGGDLIRKSPAVVGAAVVGAWTWGGIGVLAALFPFAFGRSNAKVEEKMPTPAETNEQIDT